MSRILSRPLQSSQFNVYPITQKSSSISFSEWVTLFTLCLAPLLAHIISGTPSPSYLYSNPRPKWHDRICQFNPTTILWRYASITDRRIRARKWDTIDMAATNALFWTRHGWDGSEAMINSSLIHCLHLPEQARASILSVEMMKTWVVTFQGVQVVALLVAGLSGDYSNNFPILMGLDIIFLPVAFFGLARLFCMLWLTNDFLYTGPRTINVGHAATGSNCLSRISLDSLQAQPDPARAETKRAQNIAPSNHARKSQDSLLCLHTRDSMEDRFLPTTYWASRAFRVIFLTPILSMWIVCVMFMAADGRLTMTTFLAQLFYLGFLTATIIIFTYCFLRGETSTIIICIASTWYKIYTIILIAFAAALITVACVETRKTPCGKYTSLPGLEGDVIACSLEHHPYLLDMDSSVSSNDTSVFSVATTYPSHNYQNESLLDYGEFWVFNFTGQCFGNMDSVLWRRSLSLNVLNASEYLS